MSFEKTFFYSNIRLGCTENSVDGKKRDGKKCYVSNVITSIKIELQK